MLGGQEVFFSAEAWISGVSDSERGRFLRFWEFPNSLLSKLGPILLTSLDAAAEDLLLTGANGLLSYEIAIDLFDHPSCWCLQIAGSAVHLSQTKNTYGQQQHHLALHFPLA